MSDPLGIDEILAQQFSGAEDQVGLGEEFALSRRSFVQMFLGAGLLITVSTFRDVEADEEDVPRRGGRGGGGRSADVSARVHVGKDGGTITVLTGKVECGQGARAELTQAAAEELRVPASRIQLIMADTELVPDDGITAGSGSTPRTVPEIRRGAAAARDVLIQLACKKWEVDKATVEARDGKILHAASKREISYGELAAGNTEAFKLGVPAGTTVRAVKDWTVLGTSVPRPNGRDIVTGAHHYPSDIQRPGMCYGKILRAPAYGATLKSIDTAPAKAMPGVTVVEDGSFVGVVAPTAYAATMALGALAKSAQWNDAPAQPSSGAELYDHLRKNAQGGVPRNPFGEELGKAKKVLRQTYHVPYVQHTPMEPRAGVAEFKDGK